MATFLKKEHTRLRLKQMEVPISTSPVLGAGIDVAKCPDGHLSCPICRGFKFECSVVLDSRRIEIGCMHCGWSDRLLLPFSVDLSQFSGGRFTCFKHQEKGMVIINNSGKLCVGCEACKTQVVINISDGGLVLA